ncbi:MAG TPA: hypothetical protein VFG30_26080 [Polyangiales bacterium]|nr:hypothetical protein [Polyangiales bacterium]
MPLRTVTMDELTIVDEADFAHVAEYAKLKRSLRASSHRFRVPAEGTQLSWDRALFLNLTFWNAKETTDVLCETHVPADTIAHVAWHCLAGPQLERLVSKNDTAAPSAAALLFAESIASAFDLYLVGRLLRNVPDSNFIESQVPIMAEAASEAGLSEGGFEALLESVVDDPERAFEDLRALLFDATRALSACNGADEAELVFERFQTHRFEPLLHHYALSTWVLYPRAHGSSSPAEERAVLELDATLRAAPVALEWLIKHWVDSPD